MTNYEKMLISYTNLSDLLVSLTDSLASSVNTDEITDEDLKILNALVDNLAKIGSMNVLDCGMRVGDE